MQDKNFKLVIGGALAIGLIATIVLMSIAVTIGFDKAMRTSTTSAVNGITAPTGINQSVTLTSYPYISTLTGCVNASDGTTIAVGNYSVIEGTRTGGRLKLLDNTWANETWNCSALTYLPASTGSGSVNSFITGLAIFGLFAGILALGVIGKAIINLLKS